MINNEKNKIDKYLMSLGFKKKTKDKSSNPVIYENEIIHSNNSISHIIIYFGYITSENYYIEINGLLLKQAKIETLKLFLSNLDIKDWLSNHKIETQQPNNSNVFGSDDDDEAIMQMTNIDRY